MLAQEWTYPHGQCGWPCVGMAYGLAYEQGDWPMTIGTPGETSGQRD